MVLVSPSTGAEGNSVVGGAESNGERVLSGEPGDGWPGEVDGVGGGPTPLSLEERAGVGVADGEEDKPPLENRLGEDCVDERPNERPQNCEGLSPPDQEAVMEGTEPDSSSRATIIMVPLEGSNAELRTRVMKEVRKPGRSEYLPILSMSL